jgi:hypothetical protein
MRSFLFAFLMLPVLTFSQFRKEPEKKDNAVIIHGVTFHDAVRKLIDMGYRMDKIDSNYQIVQVNIDEYQTMYIRFDTAHNMIVTSDMYIHGNMFAQHSPVLYWKSSFNRARWDLMMKYAGSFPNLEYAKL